MTTEDALSGTGPWISEGKMVVGLSDQQKAETREIVVAAIREYWTEDAIKRLAEDRAKVVVNSMLETSISSKVANLCEAKPDEVMRMMFHNSGMMVRNKCSEQFDEIVTALLKDDASGIPEAIRQHVRDNLPELVQNAISGVVAAMVVNYLSGNADALAEASRTMISRAFQNASIRSY